MSLGNFVLGTNRFRLGNEVDQGDQSVVYEVTEYETGKKYAAKVGKEGYNKEIEQKLTIREIEILSQISHPAIIKLRGFSLSDFDSHPFPVLFTELMPNGSLRKILDLSKTQTIEGWNNTRKQIVVLGIASALEYLHSLHIMHRNINPMNVFLDENFYPHIGGFHLSKIYDPKNPNGQTLFRGKRGYIAPEVLTEAFYDWRVDIYSYAIVIHEILSGEIPFTNSGNSTALSFSSKLQPAFLDLIKRCTSADPADRPSFTEIVRYLCSDESYYLPGIDRNEYARYEYEMLTFGRKTN
ncbi:AGC family protein kinase [Histomonas meleagridis]|uniref:AGC family protein kinase n=1 Tax=Histomonas meleagridis TaxID=135588 RepID=UPI00355A0D65|nr:AGC family protein kinase [Histomonas meleagridis]KAH0799160.1 AGC family protein kinase [Histomonas meleagridis]